MSHILQYVSRSTLPVITVNDIKSHCRIDTSTDDLYLLGLIDRAINLIEAESNRDLVPTTWSWKGNFPHPKWHFGFASPMHNHDFVDGYYRGFRHKILMPRGPLQSIHSVAFYDVGNNHTTWTNSQNTMNYYVMTPHDGLGWIQPALYWPATYDAFRPDAVEIQFVSGDTSVKPIAKHAVCLAVSNWYEHREAEVEVRLQTIGMGFDRLLDQLRLEAIVG